MATRLLGRNDDMKAIFELLLGFFVWIIGGLTKLFSKDLIEIKPKSTRPEKNLTKEEAELLCREIGISMERLTKQDEKDIESYSNGEISEATCKCNFIIREEIIKALHRKGHEIQKKYKIKNHDYWIQELKRREEIRERRCKIIRKRVDWYV